MFSLCIAMLAVADPVGKQAALYTAQSYMLAKGKTVAPTPAPLPLTQRGATARKASPLGGQQEEAWDSLFYIFNAGNDGGYVIVSGDDRTEPILGYVEHGTFDPDNIPENMRSWLQLYADQIRYIIDNDIKAESPMLKKRNKVRGTKHSVPELLTTRWNQGEPYNITCPDYYLEDDEDEPSPLPLRSRPATGCTATAMAQVLAFYKYPEKTKAIIPAYSVTYTSKQNGSQKTMSQKAIPRNTPIDWDNMQDTYSWNNEHVANAQDSAVANLMHYCGQAVNMHYGPSSGANFNADVFVKIFGYDASAYMGYRGDYSIDDWFDAIYHDIAEGYPVCFAGFSSGGGHAFVLDGFDGENLFHVNWGWGGGSNGWFLVGILNPGDNSGIGASSSSDGYSMGQYALLNLRLPDNNNADTYLFMKDISVTGTTIRTTFENRTTISGSFHGAIVKLDDDGGLSVVGTQQSISALAVGASQTKSFALKNKLPEGTYKLSPANKAAKSNEWRTQYNLENHYIEAVVDADGAMTLTPVNITNGNSISIDTIMFPGNRTVGNKQEVKVVYHNNGDEYYKEVLFYASKTQDKIYTEYRAPVAVRKGETVEVSYYFTPDEIGTYNLWFCTGWDGSGVVGQGTVEITETNNAPVANLSINSYTITNAVSGIIYGKELVGKVSIKNNAKTDFHGPINLQLWNQPTGSSYAWGGTTHTYEVDIMAGRIATIDISFDNLSENNKYFIAASYVSHQGNFGNSGVWDLGGWDVKAGVETWKNDGSLTGKVYAASMTTLSTICGVYADCSKKINHMTPNKNLNTIYAFSASMDLPANLDTSTVANVVSGDHSRRIKLNNSNPYYNPVNFQADSATFTYTFPEAEDGTRWHAFTMPFEADSIFIDDTSVTLLDSLNHFWIYEFSAQGSNGEVIFTPAKVLRGNTPYIIAADATMAGRSVVFRSSDVPVYKTSLGKMVVTSTHFKFHGNTCSPKVTNSYIMNEAGTAFEFISKNTTLNAQESYFTTNLSEEMRPISIQLPAIPQSPAKAGDLNGDGSIDIADAVSVLDIMASDGYSKDADLNKDNAVDIADFVSILEIMVLQ